MLVLVGYEIAELNRGGSVEAAVTPAIVDGGAVGVWGWLKSVRDGKGGISGGTGGAQEGEGGQSRDSGG